jgi:hypothetical protein
VRRCWRGYSQRFRFGQAFCFFGIAVTVEIQSSFRSALPDLPADQLAVVAPISYLVVTLPHLWWQARSSDGIQTDKSSPATVT